MQSFSLSCLTRSLFVGALVGSTLVGFYGLDDTAIAGQSKNTDALETINSNHWAFKSLKTLAERYGCAVNASGMYFQPSEVLSRYEMAAAVNWCLDQIADRFETTEDWVTAQILFKAFKKEVEILRSRREHLEDRTVTLESQQISPTTKLFVDSVIYSQFPGLKPTHWSFQAAQSLSQRYDCVPYSPSTFGRKGGTISRYEMAIFLNSCFNQIGHRFANQKDSETAQALQKEFKPELITLKDRIDFLENRAAMLESHQFSTTTKLQGQAIITIQGGGFR